MRRDQTLNQPEGRSFTANLGACFAQPVHQHNVAPRGAILRKARGKARAFLVGHEIQHFRQDHEIGPLLGPVAGGRPAYESDIRLRQAHLCHRQRLCRAVHRDNLVAEPCQPRRQRPGTASHLEAAPIARARQACEGLLELQPLIGAGMRVPRIVSVRVKCCKMRALAIRRQETPPGTG